LPGAKRRAATIIHEFCAATKNGEFNLTLRAAIQNRHPVFARLIDHRRCRRSVDAIRNLSIASRNREANSPGKQPHEIVGLEIDHRVGIKVQRAVVGEENLNPAVLSPEAVASKKRHVRW
jgi:hypothetical protein